MLEMRSRKITLTRFMEMTSFKDNLVNMQRSHNYFKSLIVVQRHVIETPNMRRYTNWKIFPIITWVNYIFPLIWLLWFAISIDEVATSFKGNHKYKNIIKCNDEGDGFQANELFQDGFTYHIFMEKDPDPPRYTDQGLSPIHTIVMALFDVLMDMCHRCTMGKFIALPPFSFYRKPQKKVMC